MDFFSMVVLLDRDQVSAESNFMSAGRLPSCVLCDGPAAEAGTGDVKHGQIVIIDDPLQMEPDEIPAWRRAPVIKLQRTNTLRHTQLH
jgi:hypothetical protein